MKKRICNISWLLALLAVVTLGFTACETDNDSNPTLDLSHVGEGFTLNTPANAQNNTYDLANAKSVELTCSQPNYGGMPLMVRYYVQVSLTEDFASYKELATSYTTAKMAVNAREINDAMVELFQEANPDTDYPATPRPLYIKLRAVIDGTDNMGETYSNVITLPSVLATYQAPEAMYYLVGAMNGWAASTQNMLYTQGGNVYSYTTLWEGDANLKIWDSKGLGDWAVCWGSQVDGDTSLSGSLINSKAQAIKAPTTDEYYTFTMDMNAQTYTWKKLDPATITDYTSVSLIGGFNNWDEGGTEVDLTEVTPHNWYGVMTLEADGDLKFRANHTWDVSWGAASTDTPLGDSYYLPIGGQNISVSAGTYAFYLNDITGEWNIVRQE